MDSFNAQQIGFLVILAAAFALLLTERIRNDLVAVLIILALYLTRILAPAEALAGFSSEPAIVVAGVFVLSGALRQTGLSTDFGAWIGRLAGSGYHRAIAVIMPAVALLSAFTHHVTTTAVMLPVMLNLSRERGIPSSKLLMPLSFAASLGTTITIIGAPAFLIADGVLRQAGRPGLGIFSIAPIGLTLSLVGTAFMLVAGRLLLPARRGGEGAVDRFRLDDYFTELTILPDSHFLEKTIDEVEADKRYKLKVVGWLREGRRMRRPFKDQLLGAGDALLIRTRPEDILAIRQEPGVELRAFMEQGEQGAEAPSPGGDEEEITDVLAQAVVAPGSDHAGREIGEIDFRRRYGVVVLGLWRKEGWLDRELAKITLHPGDVLALQGDEESLARVERDPAFLRGKAHVIVVVAEGAEYNAEKLTRYFKRRRERLGFDLRVTTLGHVQRGGAPGAFDRLLATRFGAAATERLGRGEHGVLVGLIKGEIAATPLDEVVTNRKRLEPGLFELARALAK